MKAKGKTRITAVEMDLMSQTLKYPWMEHKRNEDILKIKQNP
jgi:hypothetical protein